MRVPAALSLAAIVGLAFATVVCCDSGSNTKKQKDDKPAKTSDTPGWNLTGSAALDRRSFDILGPPRRSLSDFDMAKVYMEHGITYNLYQYNLQETATLRDGTPMSDGLWLNQVSAGQELYKTACRRAAVNSTDELASKVQGDVFTVFSHFTDVPKHPFVKSGLMLLACTILQGPPKCYRKYEPPTGKGNGAGCGIAPDGFKPVESSKGDLREVLMTYESCIWTLKLLKQNIKDPNEVLQIVNTTTPFNCIVGCKGDGGKNDIPCCGKTRYDGAPECKK